MDTRKIGTLDVSVVGVGCNNFGNKVDEAGTRAVVDAAVDAGVTFFDTADIYARGDSERFLGRALRGRRDRAIVATKFGHKNAGPLAGGRPETVRRAAEESLRRLDVERIDLYQMHQPDPTVPIDETLGALRELVDAGMVREIGCSNFSVDQLRDAERAAARVGVRFVSVQNEYSLFHREPEHGVLDACAELGLAFLPYYPLASGLLTGKYRRGREVPAGTRLSGGRYAELLSDENLDVVERLVALAASRGHTVLELAVSWLLAHRTVASVIAGATHPEQVRANAAAADWRLTDVERREIDAIAPALHAPAS
jgi:aryl-alcohol dehydrogenase-like predicted oxidoreductase